MVGDLSSRIDEWLPHDLTDMAEIEAAVDGTRYVSELAQNVRRSVIETVSKDRDPNTSAIQDEVNRRTDVAGPQTEARRPQLRKSDGSFGPRPENVKSQWEDRWGNIMIEDTDGNRHKLADSEDRI